MTTRKFYEGHFDDDFVSAPCFFLDNKKDIRYGCLLSRGNRIRTRIYGFGDRCSTIELYPFMFIGFCNRLLYTNIGTQICQHFF